MINSNEIFNDKKTKTFPPCPWIGLLPYQLSHTIKYKHSVHVWCLICPFDFILHLPKTEGSTRLSVVTGQFTIIKTGGHLGSSDRLCRQSPTFPENRETT